MRAHPLEWCPVQGHSRAGSLQERPLRQTVSCEVARRAPQHGRGCCLGASHPAALGLLGGAEPTGRADLTQAPEWSWQCFPPSGLVGLQSVSFGEQEPWSTLLCMHSWGLQQNSPSVQKRQRGPVWDLVTWLGRHGCAPASQSCVLKGKSRHFRALESEKLPTQESSGHGAATDSPP